MSERERKLLQQHSFVLEELICRLRVVPNQRAQYGVTLEEWDELAGYVAPEANHSKEKKLRKGWDRLYERIAQVLEGYTDEEA